MPDSGADLLVTAPKSHTSTPQWKSFEVRMRRKRAERCLIRADLALNAGLMEEAQSAVDEARQLAPDLPELGLIDRRIAAGPPLATDALAPVDAPRRGAVPAARAAPTAVTLPEPAANRAKNGARAGLRVTVGAAACLALAALGVIYRHSAGGGIPPVRSPEPQRVAVAADPAPVPSERAPDAQPEAPSPDTTVPQAPTRASEASDQPPLRPQPVSGDVAAARDRPGGRDQMPLRERPGGREAEPAIPNAPLPGVAGRGLDVPPRAPVIESAPLSAALVPPSTAVPAPAAAPTVPTDRPAESTPRSGEAGFSTGTAGAAAAGGSSGAGTAAGGIGIPGNTDAQAAVRSALARYEAAFSGLDVAAARAVWPAVDGRALSRAFDGLASQRIALGRCDVSVTGASARATCAGSAEWTPKVGGGQRRQNRRWSFDLANAGGAWQIVRADAR